MKCLFISVCKIEKKPILTYCDKFKHVLGLSLPFKSHVQQ